MARISYIWRDNNIHFEVGQHPLLDFYSVNSETSQLVDMSYLSDALLWFRATQSKLLFLNAVFLGEKQEIQILLSL